MLHKRLKLSMILLFGLLISGVQAQEIRQAIIASGGGASGSGGSAAYTVGQLVSATNTDASGTVFQGIQLPYEIEVVTGIDEAISLSISAFPNPTTSYLTLKVDDWSTKKLNYNLFDMNGRLLESRKISDFETTINMHSLKPAMYFIKIVDGSKEVKNFKIIKN